MSKLHFLFLRQGGAQVLRGKSLELIRDIGLLKKVVMAIKQRIFISISVADLRKILLVACTGQ
jgi:hypothetical protein